MDILQLRTAISSAKIRKRSVKYLKEFEQMGTIAHTVGHSRSRVSETSPKAMTRHILIRSRGCPLLPIARW